MNVPNEIWSGLTDDPIKTITAISAIGGLIFSWLNYRRGGTEVDVVVKRSQYGPLALQNQHEEHLLFEVYNKSSTPLAITEIGIKIGRGKYLNLVNLPWSDLHEPNKAVASPDSTNLPGTLNPAAKGIFLISYSNIKQATNNIQERSDSESETAGALRLIKAANEFRKRETNNGEYLELSPYVLTGSNKRFMGENHP